MMALMNAQGRFVLTAFSPLLFNIALIATMIALVLWRQDAALAALVIAATVGIAGLLQLSILVLRRGGSVATPLRVAFDPEMRGFFRPGHPRHDRERLAATACHRRRGDRVVLAVGGVVAVFPPTGWSNCRSALSASPWAPCWCRN